jgi:general secretion pathway protein G
MVQRKKRAARRSGFTLMEVLVVVAILVVLAGIAVPLYLRYADEARVSAARLSCRNLSQAVESYKLKYGDFPANLEMLAQVQGDGSPPYIEPAALVDPWQRRFEYAPQGPHNASLGKPDIWSQGPRPGDPNGVVGNW